jgi:hypothetical protein
MIFLLNFITVFLISYLLISKTKISNSKKYLFFFLLLISPIVIKININITELLIFILISFLFVIKEYCYHPKIKFILNLIILLSIIFFINNLSGLLNKDLSLDISRTYFKDTFQIEKIIKVQEEAVYLKFRLRKYLFGNWIIIISLLKKFFDYFWFHNILLILNIFLIYPLILGFNKKNKNEIIMLILIVFSSVINRNPNTFQIFYFSFPIIIKIIIGGLSIIKANKYVK